MEQTQTIDKSVENDKKNKYEHPGNRPGMCERVRFVCVCANREQGQLTLNILE